MELYVCWGTWGVTPRPNDLSHPHPCGAAHRALKEAGHEPKVIRCFGWKELPDLFNQTPGRRRVKELTGDNSVPVLVTDEGEVVAGSREIAGWAKRSPA